MQTVNVRIRSQWAWLVLSAVVFAGCNKGEQITSYRVPKSPPSAGGGIASRGDVDMSRDRMLAAIVPHEKQMWFFKLNGENEPVAKVEPAFLDFVKSLHFSVAGEPEWTLPPGWKVVPDASADKNAVVARHATLEIESSTGPLELSVTQLPVRGNTEEFLLDNINRWRQQLGLPPTTTEQLGDAGSETKEIVLDGTKATVINIVGFMGSSSMGNAPFAGGLPSRPRPAINPPSRSAEAPMKYDAPPEWTESRGTGLSVASFMVGSGDSKVEITVTPLAAAAMAGDLAANVNRWRGQVGLPPLAADELNQTTRKIEVAGARADFVEVVGPEDAKPRQSILGAVLIRGGTAWFFKLMGDADLAAAEKDRFEQFVRSVKFSAPDGADNGK